MITYVDGDILEAPENFLVQSVNHRGLMGAGLAKALLQKHPKIIDNYKIMCEKLSYEEIKRDGLVSWYKVSEDKYVVSIFGQEYYGRNKKYTDYVSLGNGLETVRLFAQSRDYTVAIPSGIGCGLGGGDWDIVQDIIEQCFRFSQNLEVKIYRKPENIIHQLYLC